MPEPLMVCFVTLLASSGDYRDERVNGWPCEILCPIARKANLPGSDEGRFYKPRLVRNRSTCRSSRGRSRHRSAVRDDSPCKYVLTTWLTTSASNSAGSSPASFADFRRSDNVPPKAA